MEASVLRFLLLLALAGGLLTLAGCGGDSESAQSEDTTVTTSVGTGDETETEGEEEESTPEEALDEIEAIGPLLDDAVTQYESGDHDGAADAVGDIYLDHFEKVEGPLGNVNHDLMEDLEKAISTDLRQAMENDEPDEKIESMVADIKSDLDKAEQELEAAA
jgi:hypothetical protein